MRIEKSIVAVLKGVVSPSPGEGLLCFRVICQAVLDSMSKNGRDRQSAQRYLTSERFNQHAKAIDLDTRFAKNIFSEHLPWYGPVMLRNIHSWSQEISESAEYLNDVSSERRDSISNSELVVDISELSGKAASLAGWGTNYPITEIAGSEWKPGRL